MTKPNCDVQREGDRGEVTHAEVNLGKRKCIHFFESDEKEVRKNEYWKMLLSIMLSRSIHAVTKGRSSFFLSAV